ncbi:MAG: RIO-type serine/threonine-protein kinase Rio1 [Candidatus Woesearchaeota archaeon]|nr:RIO-type serine/threonine-protein kinase Rio1 [Candidatus Woesearchaeota archaeon]
MGKTTPERFRVYKNVFDNFTLRTLFDLSTKKYFTMENLVPISIGKEANVFWGQGKYGDVVLKIYRLQSCDFNKMYDYMRYDPRFSEISGHSRKVVFAWAQREYRNLLNAREARISAPTPFMVKNNVLIMEMVGKIRPAPKLKDAFPKKPKEFFDKLVSDIKKFYKFGYVHGDLSQFNILNNKGKPVMIDMSQATPLSNPNAMPFMKRDIKIICKFFTKNGYEVDSEKIIKNL